MPIASRLVSLSVAALFFATAHCGATSDSTDLGDPGAPAPSASNVPATSTSTKPPTPASGADAGTTTPPRASDAGHDAAPDATIPPSTPPQAPDASTPPQQGAPCANVTCAADEVCVPYAHGAPLGACVPTCDCSNCGNCGGDNADGRWNDEQEYCGNRAASPATMACNKPCQGAGNGCIPWGATSICWPLEGCFSL